ncbi:unnamed protein product [Calicophoron daubneyi]|uniref:Large ribosomal subunit protein mL38 n=1 Tax=Calicophoron daubneyi TaxID=300641 RepID=A0AAV2T073_CALDB
MFAFRQSEWFVTTGVSVIRRNYWYRRGYLPPDVEPGRYPYPKRQVPECGTKCFTERLVEICQKPSKSQSLDPVDIGLPYVSSSSKSRAHTHSKRPELEPAARKHTLKIPLDLVHSVTEDRQAPMRLLSVAKHYDIFNALFGSPHFFVPQFNIGVYYNLPEEHKSPKTDKVTSSLDEPKQKEITTVPVYMGNIIAAQHAMQKPLLDLSFVPSDHLWTLVMTCPDEPIGGEDGSMPANEYVHWLISNLRVGAANDSGEEIIPYLPPLPYQGTGFHRYVFTLYRQDNGSIDLKSWKKEKSTGDLRNQRQFSTAEFYKTFESDLTPGGLGFFQSEWDDSVRRYFREVLNTPEPIFDIEWPSPKLPPQEKFPVTNSWNKPRRHPLGIPLIQERYGVHNDVSFDVYLDRYRDRKELEEELVCERLAAEGNPIDPNDERRKRPAYPAAVPVPRGMPTWWRKQQTMRLLRKGRWARLEDHDG